MSSSNQQSRVFGIDKTIGVEGLVKSLVPAPAPGPGEVLVHVRASSLNYRDVIILEGNYYMPIPPGRIPLSDGAGEIAAVGSGVTHFKVGDRVTNAFCPDWIDGPYSPGFSQYAGDVDGWLADYRVVPAESLVHLPDGLTFEEAATLPCAGVTAYRALFVDGALKKGQFVLLEGTGGVSTFGLQLAAAAGARPIITSSSDEKLERAKKLGAAGTVNYRTNENWQREVRTLTGNAGVSHVLEVGGRDTLPKALEALAFEGHIALIGGLSGFASDVPVGRLMGLGASTTGIYVGSRADFEAMNRFVAQHKIRPVVDRAFAFEEAAKAYEFMDNGSYFGKIVIRVGR